MVAGTSWSNRFKAVVFGLGLGLALLNSGNWWRILTDRVPLCGQPNCVADFVTFHAQGSLFWQDRHSLYDLDKQLEFQKKVAPTERVLPFVYPPITALLFAPFALLPFPAAFLVATLANFLLITASLRRLTTALSLTRDQLQWLVLFALCNFGVQAVVFYGQTSALVLYFMTRHIVATKQRRELNAGAWAGLLCLKPQYLPVPHLVLLLRHNWRGLAVGIVASVTLILGAFALIGPEATRQYFALAQRMVSMDNDWWNQLGVMHNLRALTIYWLPGRWQPYFWAAGCVGVIAALIFTNLRAGEDPRDFAGRWIVNLLGLLIVIPHLFTHDLTLLVIPAALLLSLGAAQVPLGLGLVLSGLGMLPAVNYLLPTIMATTLVALFILSLVLTGARRKQG
jgi:hypothetical protein